MTYQLSWGADLRRHFYNSCTRLTIYAVGVLVSVCVCGDAAAVLFLTWNLCPCFQVRVANVLMATSRHLSAAKWRMESADWRG